MTGGRLRMTILQPPFTSGVAVHYHRVAEVRGEYLGEWRGL